MNPTTESPTRRFLHRVLPLSLGLALLATLACGGDKAAAPPPPTPTVPVIASFAAAPAAITAGQSSTLSWSVSGHTSLAINQNVGAVTGSSQTVSPTSTLTYTLTATNATGSSTATATVTVTVTVTPVTPDTTAPSIPTGLAASTITATGLTLTWTAATDNVAVTGYRVYRGTATAPIAALTTGTTYTDTGLTASTPYTYTVVAFDAAGNASAKSSPVTATTSAVATTPVISAFTASPTTITAGGSSTLAWTVTGATSLSINNGVGTVTGSSRVVTPSATTTYTLTATNASGPVTRSAQVTVNPVGNVFHVRQSATGANNGSDWTNAFTELPSTLNRGAVYHVADGTYPGYTFDDVVSGTSLITIQKATAANHGSGAGWQDSFGDGVATFTAGLTFTTPYWNLDGVTGAEKTGHGFHVSMTARGVGINLQNGAHHITVAHSKISWPDRDNEAHITSEGLVIYGNAPSVTLRYLYLEEIPGCPFFFIGPTNLLMEYCVTDGMHNDPARHASGIIIRDQSAANGTIRYNKFGNTEGSYAIGFYNNAAPVTYDGWSIYGNVFWWDTTSPKTDTTSHLIAYNLDAGITVSNILIANNTFVDLRPSGRVDGKIAFHADLGNRVVNNYFHGMAYHTVSGASWDYNYYSNCTAPYAFTPGAHENPWVQDATHHSTDTANHFLNAAQYDFRLSAPLAGFPGQTLAAPYTTDMNGKTRGADCVWERGAFEFDVVASTNIIADHSIVADYSKIPQRYIDIVKTWRVNLDGESHSTGYRRGLEQLQALDPKFSVVTFSGNAPTPTTSQLRFGSAGRGEGTFFTNATALASVKSAIQTSQTQNNPMAVIGFGWCWDMTATNGPGGTRDTVHGVRWAGRSEGGPQGSMRWGLDAGDEALTGNSVCMDTYLNAVEEYRAYCTTNSYGTVPIFTTGPVDGSGGSENGFQRELKHQYIRDFVKRDPKRVLFDYADILTHNNAGEKRMTTWNDGGTARPHANIHPDNQTNEVSGTHIGQEGCLRLGKAMWWMLARQAGWDGVSN